MNKEEALYAFWNSIDSAVGAFDETTVPDTAPFPRITYNVATDSLNNVVPLHVDVVDSSNSWRKAQEIKDKISKRVNEKGFVTIPFDGGYIYLCGGAPFAQRVDDPDDDRIKRYYINLTAEFLCQY